MNKKKKNELSTRIRPEESSKALSGGKIGRPLRPLRKRHRALFCVMTDYVKNKETIVFSENLSMGGVFLETSDPLPPGTKVKLRFPLKSVYRPILIEGKVIWNQKAIAHEKVGNKTPGMGITFQKIKKADAEIIKELLDQTYAYGWFL